MQRHNIVLLKHASSRKLLLQVLRCDESESHDSYHARPAAAATAALSHGIKAALLNVTRLRKRWCSSTPSRVPFISLRRKLTR